MSSIIEGYNYDIFISYRQKDNKGDKWVSEFVEALKTELESTFKEEISVYFDINPHDGLLESYDVDASLKEKLKCLIFIPVISRTYSDPKSFAWEHEFKAFVEQASHDQFGLKVNLPNGNVASRVLPIRIHDLDLTDIKECESVLGGVLRGIEFIYKEPGIDKPLVPGDDEKKNLNATKYRIQIIKVAHIIKEIILGMRTEPVRVLKEEGQPEESLKTITKDDGKNDQEKPDKEGRHKLIYLFTIIAVLVIAGILIYPKIFKRNALESLKGTSERISVAVMPFQNLTNDTIWNIWQYGMQNELITSLTNSKELKVRQAESINRLIQSKGVTNYALLTPSFARNISLKLDANVFIYGSIKKVGEVIRINAQLADSKTKDTFKTFQIDGKEENILRITDSLSAIIRDFLVISIMEKDIIRDFRPLISTNYPEAYRYYMYGNQAFYKTDYHTASEWYKKAIDIDSCFYESVRMLIYSLGHQGLAEEAEKWMLRNYQKRNQMSVQEKIWSDIQYAMFFETPFEVIKHFKLLIAFDDEIPVPHGNLAAWYMVLSLYAQAISESEKELEIYNNWGIQPRWGSPYITLGEAYHKTGMYRKEKKVYREAEKYFPESPDLLRRQAILELSVNKTKKTNEYLEKYISDRKANSASEVNLTYSLAQIYSEANLLDKAEEYYRKAHSMIPENLNLINEFAYFLIDKDRDVNEGLELIKKGYKLGLDEFYYADAMGLGLYKQGKYQEALEFFQRSWDTRPGYNHDVYLHLEAAKKAVANQKTN